MSDDRVGYAARRCGAQPSTLTATGLREAPACQQRRAAGMRPLHETTKELVFVRRRSFYENASSFGARFYETLLLPPLPYLLTVFQINSHPFDADTAGRNTPRLEKVRLAHFPSPFLSWRNGLPCP